MTGETHVTFLVDDKQVMSVTASAVPNVGERVWLGGRMTVSERRWYANRSRLHPSQGSLGVEIVLVPAEEGR